MKLIEKMNQSRRDFTGKYECESCGHIEIHHGCYDDRNFHANVTPHWKCGECGKTTLDVKDEPGYIPTKYGDFEHI